MDEQGEEWVGVDEAAAIAGVSRWTIGRADPRELPFREASGGSTRRRAEREYRRHDVEAYRDARAATRPKTLAERVAELERWRAEHERGHDDT